MSQRIFLIICLFVVKLNKAMRFYACAHDFYTKTANFAPDAGSTLRIRPGVIEYCPSKFQVLPVVGIFNKRKAI